MRSVCWVLAAAAAAGGAGIQAAQAVPERRADALVSANVGPNAMAVLKAAGHDAPVNAVTMGCGLWSMLTALVGTVSTCLTGPTNAIVASSGERHRA